MASINTTSEFDGDDFSNNLFSDLAPLITLFGEQVTKQFLSTSMGWADNIILAMGPLGIMTVVVSAIRVGGVRGLKALVGRARESQSTAEQELLSSTSNDVCELWSGEEVVRMIGSPAGMKTLIIAASKDDDDSMGAIQVHDIATAQEADILDFKRRGHQPTETAVRALRNTAPNLTLNVKAAIVSSSELWQWAGIGVLVQLAALIYPAYPTYYLSWTLKDGAPPTKYGYPFFVIGTLMLVSGMIACGHIIEGITTEHHLAPRSGAAAQIKQVLRLQRFCTVSDQRFSSFAIFNSPGDLNIRVSQLNSRDFRQVSGFHSGISPLPSSSSNRYPNFDIVLAIAL
ncbi:hypothetical protein B0T19DRAFT_466722 [Cercophora scortea]|uniref:Uncharacterized protein n=1 Tax=Cercophora scortea TaxID=314031 RepID=A0AAE0IAA8_9PEZI|nr:hypothetical protein B0T19DRAFT_466722 [Cercophora scortea]